MRNILVLIILHLFLLGTAQNSAFVSISIKAPAVPDNRAVFLRGDHAFLGNWAPGAVKLQKKNANEWVGIFIFPKKSKVSFVVDLGNTANMAASNGQLIDTIRAWITSDTLMQLEVDGFTNLSGAIIPKGTLYRLPNTVPNGLRDRLVVVRTPHGYEEDTSSTYPIIFFQDGQDAFSSAEAMKGTEWRLDEVLDSLEFHGLIRPVIVVAIHHVFDTRSMEYADTELGERYRKYMTEHLRNLVMRQFRVSNQAEDQILMGAVAGAYVSFEMAWEHPEIFGKLACFSPAFKAGDNDIFKKLHAYDGPPKELELYVDIGEFEQEDLYRPGYLEMVSYLEDNQYRFESHFEPNTISNVVSFRQRLWRPLLQFLGTTPSAGQN